MNINFYLTVTRNGSVRVTKNHPQLMSDEITIAVQLFVPRALFLKPHLSATLTIPEEAARPQEIAVDVIENVKEAIEQSTGLRVELAVQQP